VRGVLCCAGCVCGLAVCVGCGLLGCVELGCVELGCVELGCVELGCVELGCVELGCVNELMIPVPRYCTVPTQHNPTRFKFIQEACYSTVLVSS